MGPDLNDLFDSAEVRDPNPERCKTGDCPFQQPDKLILSRNLKTARRSGIEFTALLLARADEVIE